MTTPYVDLGLEPSATPDEIRAAYRKLAMKHHPGRNGDAVEFKRVQNAYDVLSDPERRLQYDTTGTTEQMMTMRQAAETLIPQLADEAIDGCQHPELQNLHSMMVRNVHRILSQDRSAQADAVAGRDKLKKVMKRFKRKGGENMVGALLQSKIDSINTFLDNNTQHQLFLAEVLDVLNDYSYTVGDEPEPATPLLENDA